MPPPEAPVNHGDRVAFAPGRVNLIGEHTDYNGLPVLPMALTRGIRIAFRPRGDDQVRLANTDRRFEPVSFVLGRDIPAGPAGAWGNYPRAAARALVREAGVTRGIEGTVSSTLPIAAGLSSSSALVVATALALLKANAATVEPAALMELLARAERYVGVRGGGMDQAVSLGGRAGHAVRIDFRPALRLALIPVPPDWRFVVAASGVEAAKAAAARESYNARVRECREALDRFAARWLGGVRCADYADLGARMPAEEALARAPQALDGVLHRRFRHVVSEGARVNAAESAMRSGDAAAFGRLMRASHASLRDDYEVSSPALDRLVDAAHEAGAAGARLTGAGFGGCTVALTTADYAGRLVTALGGISREVFVAGAGDGARA